MPRSTGTYRTVTVTGETVRAFTPHPNDETTRKSGQRADLDPNSRDLVVEVGEGPNDPRRARRRGTPTAVKELNTPSLPVNCFMPSVSGDGLTMFVCISHKSGLGGYDLYMTTRAHRSHVWGPPLHLKSISSSSSDHRPSISPDGRQLFFSSARTTTTPGLSSNNIWMARFIGLSYQNLPQIGKTLLLHVTEPGSWGLNYQVALALSNARGIPVPGVGIIPLDLDNLLIASTSNALPSVFSGFAGQLDSFGEATAKFIVPNAKELIGVYFHAAALTYGKSGVRYITNGRSLAIHQ